MKNEEIKRFLEETLDDEKISRGEKKVFKEVINDLQPNSYQKNLIISEAFNLVSKKMSNTPDKNLLKWLEDVINIIRSFEEQKNSFSKAFFFPNDSSLLELISLISQTKRKMDICVFTITFDVISDEIIRAFKRNVNVRIITDDEKIEDAGSDIHRMKRQGIPIVHDHSSYHMHHKFAIFDENLLLNGSFNWTRSASLKNQENFLVTDNQKLIHSYLNEFNRLWKFFSK